MFIEIQTHIFNKSEIVKMLWDDGAKTLTIHFRGGSAHCHTFRPGVLTDTDYLEWKRGVVAKMIS